MHLDYTKVIILILWWRNFQLEYWRTFQLVSTNNIYFEFDKTEITPKAATIIDEIAQIMLTDTSKKYLITGCTDAKGSSQYNMDLSQKRADAVVNALIKKGVPNKMLKAKGVGAKISYASQNAPNEIREGDRKIIVQIITNMDYWNYIP